MSVLLLSVFISLFVRLKCMAEEPLWWSYRGWEVRTLELKGVPDPLEKELRQGLALQGQPRLLGLFGYKRPKYSESLLRADRQRIALFLARHGYPAAETEATATLYNTALELDLVIRVLPGQPVRIGELQVLGLPVELAEPVLTPTQGNLPPCFNEQQLQTIQQDLQRRLAHNGYFNGQVEHSVALRDSDRVRVEFRVAAGARYRYNSCSVQGVETDLQTLAHRILSTAVNKPYNPELINQLRDRLRMLELFRKIDLRSEALGDSMLLLRGVLESRSPRTLDIGLGFWTGAGPAGRVRWYHRNFFRRGRGLMFALQASPQLVSLKGSIWWPALGIPFSRLQMTGGWENHWESNYRLMSENVDLEMRLQPSVLILGQGGVNFSHIRLRNLDDETLIDEKTGLETVFSAVLQWDNTDEPLQPSRGSTVQQILKWTVPGFLTESNFILEETILSLYRPLAGKAVLAGRGKLGLAWPIAGDSELPPHQRFYAGGTGSVRGFQRRMVGPLSADDIPLGGMSILETSLEVRFPVRSKIWGALFLDAGQVWVNRGDISPGDLRLAAGPGVLARTPVGPLRLDLGFPLAQRRGDGFSWNLHFSVGSPF